MQSINTVIVSVISPTSAIVTAVLSVLIGTDRLTSSLVIGGTIGFLAAILSAFDDTKLPRRKQQ
jgi:drug/metabolite transporter (DMT)-like permease